ncbi:hypothetical protein BD410DRAFT_844147 [Rickenella mellea]|uniref:Uncharacterized protein n=1 Tax=Rickenella mellea TaxID=50990 RepID=A0A4Y7PN23_9AGAM|nr:hypothetical protein BD410DRAFT_844147 [Rickenella mellea]
MTKAMCRSGAQGSAAVAPHRKRLAYATPDKGAAEYICEGLTLPELEGTPQNAELGYHHQQYAESANASVMERVPGTLNHDEGNANLYDEQFFVPFDLADLIGNGLPTSTTRDDEMIPLERDGSSSQISPNHHYDPASIKIPRPASPVPTEIIDSDYSYNVHTVHTLPNSARKTMDSGKRAREEVSLHALSTPPNKRIKFTSSSSR